MHLEGNGLEALGERKEKIERWTEYFEEGLSKVSLALRFQPLLQPTGASTLTEPDVQVI